MLEFSIDSCGKSKNTIQLYLCMHGCTDSLDGGQHLNLLRMVYIRNKELCNIIYRQPYYVEQINDALRQVHLTLFGEGLKPAIFVDQLDTCSLHFRKDEL